MCEGFSNSPGLACYPAGYGEIATAPSDFFAKLLSELQNKIMQHDFAILPLRRVI